MIKKKLNILLLLLLALLFTNLLGTTCYAYSYTFTSEDCDKIIERFATSSYQSGFKSRVWNRVNALQQEYDIVVIDFDHYSYYDYFYIYGFNTSQVTGVSNAGNRNYMSVTLSSAGYRYQVSYGNSWTNSGMSWGGGQFGTGSQQRTQYLAINNDIGSFYSGPWQSSEVLTFTPNEYFEIDINADFRDNIATIKGDTSGTEYYLVPYSSSRIRIGNMFDYHNLLGVVKRKFRYKQSICDFDLIQEFESDTDNLEYYSIADDTLVVYEYYQADTTEFITFIPTVDSGFEQFTVPIYFTSDYTSISNGVIDNVVTFSGDYYNNYNNDTNTQNIIDNTNDNENVDNIINEQLSGDVNSFSQKLGYSPLENPFLAVIRFVLEGICNTLLGTGDQTLEFEFQGETFIINSRDFATSSSLLTTFMSGVLITFYLFAFYKYGFHIYEKLQSGEFTSVIKNLSSDNNNDYKEM